MYYHASSTKDIKVLEPRVSNHGIPLIYFSKKRENILVYLSNAIEKYCKETGFEYEGIWQKWGPYGFEDNGIIRLEEYYPNALEKTYKGVSGYIYSVCNVIEADIDIKIPDTVSTSLPVEVESVEYIEDAYEAILQAEKDGLITIMRYEEMTQKMKEWNIKTIKEEYENAIDHPEYRHFLKGNFPDIINTYNDELIAYCGVNCATCNDYINEVCPSCKATKWDKDNICMPVKCCIDKKIEFCGLCESFPCKDMKDFYEESKSHREAYIRMLKMNNNS